MQGVILAAGLGTRLRPLTDRLPKPALPLCNRPLASYPLERLRAAGATRVAMNVHHLPEVLEREIEGVEFAREPVLLGTGGGLRNAARLLDGGDVFVMNGDILFWPDLEGALAHHRALGAIATVVLREDPRARALGALGIDGEGRVRTLLAPHPAPGVRELMFTGVHVLSARALGELPTEGCIIRTAYRRWIDGGEVVAGFVDASPWRDLGTPGEYLRANVDLATGSFPWPSAPSPLARDATIEGSVAACVIGARAHVAAGVHLERCVVWPDTDVERGAQGCILAGDLRVETC